MILILSLLLSFAHADPCPSPDLKTPPEAQNLSVECKEELQKRIQAARQEAARGGGSLGAFGGMNFMAPPIPFVIYEGRYLPGGDTGSMREDRVNISLPIFASPASSLTTSVAYGHVQFEDAVPLDSQILFPKDLQRIEIGAQYSARLKDERRWGLRGTLGYAEEKISSDSILAYSLSAFYMRPTSKTSTWIYSLFLANNSSLLENIPIPGFIYIYRNETFTGLFGLPMISLQWSPTFPWSYSLSIFGPTVNAEASYGSVDRWQAFAGFAWTTQRFIPRERVRQNDRFTIEEKKAMLGLRTPLFKLLAAEFQAGYSFDRKLYIGTGLFNEDGGAAHLDPSPYASWNLRATF